MRTRQQCIANLQQDYHFTTLILFALLQDRKENCGMIGQLPNILRTPMLRNKYRSEIMLLYQDTSPSESKLGLDHY